MGLKLPHIKFDPSTIKDRWGLAGLLGVIWLIIAYNSLSKPDANFLNNIVILSLTIIVIFLILSITVSEAPVKPSSEKVNIPPPRDYIPSEDQPTPEDLARILDAMEYAKHPEIKKRLKDSKQGDN